MTKKSSEIYLYYVDRADSAIVRTIKEWIFENGFTNYVRYIDRNRFGEPYIRLSINVSKEDEVLVNFHRTFKKCLVKDHLYLDIVDIVDID